MHRLREKKTRLRNWMLRKGLLPVTPLDTFGIWLREPPPLHSRRVCVLVCFSVDGTVSEHTLFLARSWHLQDFAVILVIATDRPETVALSPDIHPQLEGILIRRNSGYDFGSWATAIRYRPDLLEATLLALANDSLYGPLSSFAGLLRRVDESDADMIGMTDSYEYQHHIQSFLVFYKPRALKSVAFTRFWRGIRGGEREATIQRAELPQLAAMRAAGLAVDILFPHTPGLLTNPTLLHWKELLHDGFPFVKVQLLRENPWGADIAGWDVVMREHGYDPAMVRTHLGPLYAGSAAAKAVAR